MTDADQHGPVSPHPEESREDFIGYLRLRPRSTQWRIRSRACAVGDMVAAAAGAALFVLVAVDSVASWPSDRVLLDDDVLSRVAGVVLIPCWNWLLVSLLVLGVLRAPRDKQKRSAGRATKRMIWRTMYPSLPMRLGLGLACVVCATVVVGGFVVGGAKGGARVLPGPIYQISTLDLNDAEWTPVSADQYAQWRARFVREDGAFFTLFGLALTAGSLGLLQLHRIVIRDARSGSGRPGVGCR
jgi:hypothetical protein